jgi:hypothetical protein
MAKGYDKIEHRVNSALPEWKEWPRRLRRVYASLEDWGSSDVCIKDMVEQWGWKYEQITNLIEATSTFKDSLKSYRDSGDYPKKDGWKKSITTSQLKSVYIREGELASYAMLEQDPKAINFHRDIVDKNGMLDLSEPYYERRDIKSHTKWAEQEDAREDPVSNDSGLASFKIS